MKKKGNMKVATTMGFLLMGSLCVEMLHPEHPHQPHAHEDMLVPAATSRLTESPMMGSGSFVQGGWCSWPGVDRCEMAGVFG